MDGGVKGWEVAGSDAFGTESGAGLTGGRPEPKHLDMNGACIFTFSSLLTGICLLQEEQAPL